MENTRYRIFKDFSLSTRIFDSTAKIFSFQQSQEIDKKIQSVHNQGNRL